MSEEQQNNNTSKQPSSDANESVTAAIPASDTQSDDAQVSSLPESDQSSSTVASEQTQSNKMSGSKKKAIIAAVVAVVVIIGIIVGWFLIDQHNKAVWEQEHKQYPVRLTIVAENYNPDTSTPIPVQISGTDFEGNEVFLKALVGSADSKQITLMRGNYTLSATASPFLEDGSMYDVSSSSMDFEVVGDSDSQEGQGVASINMPVLGVESMTEDLIQTSSDKLVSLGYDQESLTKFTDAAKAKIQEYQAAQEAAAQAAAEAEAKAKRHISTEWYEFDIPEYWVGKVEYSTTEDGVTEVYPKGYPQYPLIRVLSVDPNAEVNGGDIGDGMLARETNGQGGAELWRSNWPWKAAYGSKTGFEAVEISDKATRDSVYNTLIQLYTGGALTYDEVAADPDNIIENESTTYDSYVATTIAPTLVVKNTPPA